MIQVIGTIEKGDGITSYINPLININLVSGNKYGPTLAILQIGKEVMVGETNEKEFQAIFELDRFGYVLKNPTFESVQLKVQETLEETYPTLTFNIV